MKALVLALLALLCLPACDRLQMAASFPLKNSSVRAKLVLASSSVTEGDETSFRVELEDAQQKDLEVLLTYSNSKDSQNAPAKITIPAGEKSVTVTWQIPQDGIFQSVDRTFSISAVSENIFETDDEFTIKNSDPFPTVSILNSDRYEGQTALFQINLSHPADQDLHFPYSFIPGTAGSSDYNGIPAILDIKAGDLTANISVALNSNTTCEDSKNFYLDLRLPSEAPLTDLQKEQRILENTPVTYSLTHISLNEGQSGSLVLGSDRACSFTRSLYFSSVDGTALAGTNYNSLSHLQINLPAGQTSLSVPVTTLTDNLYAPTKKFEVLLQEASYGNIGSAKGDVEITNLDTAPVLMWTASSSSTSRSSSDTIVNINWQLNKASGYITEASIALGGTGVEGTDYSVSSQTLLIPAGTTSGQFPVTIKFKNIYNGSKTLTLGLTTPYHATIGATSTHTLTITDTIPSASIAANATTTTEGNSASFTVSLNKASSSSITINYATQNGTATSGTNYTSQSGTLTFSAGETSKSITIASLDNSTVCEDAKSFSVVISSPVNASLGTPTSASVSIEDNDYPSLSVANINATEGGTATLTGTLSATCSYIVQAGWTTTNGTAIAGTDYVATSGVLQFPANSTTQTFSISLRDDSIDQGNRAFSLTFSNPSKINTPLPSPTVTIVDNESAPVLSFNQSSQTVLESAGTLNISAVLDHPTITTVTSAVSFTGTAVKGTDYTVNNETVSITSGSVTSQLQINLVRGSAGKTIILTLGTPSRGSLGSTYQFTLTIEADPYNGPVIATSSDSGRAVYLSAVGNAATLPLSLGVPTSATGLLISKAASNSPRVVDFTFSGDSSRVLFISNNTRAADTDLFSVKVDGTLSLQLNATGWATGRSVKKMKPLGSGTRAIYLADRDASGATGDLYVASIDSSSSSLNLVPSVTGTRTVYDFDVSPNGSKVVFLSDVQGAKEIYSVNPDGSNLVKINSSLSTGATVESFLITPDSSKVVFKVKNPGGEDILYVAQIASGGVTLLSSVVGSRTIPNFKISADSSKVIYLHNAVSAASHDLFSVNIGGSSRVQLSVSLVSGGSVKDFSFAANSAKVFYLAEVQSVGAPELFVINPDSSNRYKVSSTLPSGGKISAAEFLPNSNGIVYLGYQDQADKQELYAVGLSGSGKVKLNLSPVSSGNITKFKITSDSSKVIYMGDQDTAGAQELYVVSTTGTSRTRLHPALNSGRSIDQFTLLANDSKALYRSNNDDSARYDWYSVSTSGGTPTKLFAP